MELERVFAIEENKLLGALWNYCYLSKFVNTRGIPNDMKCESFFNSFTIFIHLPIEISIFVYPSISIDLFHNRELATSSTSSRAPTKDYLIKKGQGFADQNHASSKTVKSARIRFNEFIA